MRLVDLFEKASKYHPDRAFLRQGTRSISYKDANNRIHRIAASLLRDGLKAGARVAVYSTNCIELVEALFGIMRADCVFIPLNAMNAPSENVQILRQTQCEGLLFHSKFQPTVMAHQAELPDVRVLVCLDQQSNFSPSLDAWMASPGAQLPTRKANRDDAWAIYMTSGTTGNPKGVVHSHANSLIAVSDMLLCLRADRLERHLIVSPVTHMAGMMMFATSTVGATHILLETTAPESICEAVEAHRAQLLFLPPTLIYLMLATPSVRAHDYGALERFVYAGAPMAPEKVREAISVFGPVLTNIYAQTELLAPVTCLQPDEHRPGSSEAWDRRLASIGRPTQSRIAAIMDDAGTLLSSGEIGELVVRSSCEMLEYLDDPKSTDAVRQHGWHHTGDIGVCDEMGYITLVDRKKDMIVSGGFNVFSAEVERVVLGHPAVQEAAVIGVPDEKWGEAVKAVVELKKSAAVSEAELIAFCKEQLGSVKAPKSIEFRSALPRSATGKVLKKEIRADFWRGKWRNV